jgi:hypothetical protein
VGNEPAGLDSREVRAYGCIVRPARSVSVGQWLERFELIEPLRLRLIEVMQALPQPVREDLVDDPQFSICDYEPGVMAHVPVGLPLMGRPGRGVALKRTLSRRPVPFIRWVIAHELAHAHLRNRGRWDGEDPELAADALAAAWGFPKPGTLDLPLGAGIA